MLERVPKTDCSRPFTCLLQRRPDRAYQLIACLQKRYERKHASHSEFACQLAMPLAAMVGTLTATLEWVLREKR